MSKRSTSRRSVVAGNWKMHNDHGAAARLASDVRAACKGSRATVVVAPPFTALASVSAALAGSSVQVAAQNVSAHAEGAHTGEISTQMLRALGVGWVIVGHSERRQLYGETDAEVGPKLHAAIGAGLVAILCVGETLDQRDGGLAETVVADQLLGGTDDLGPVNAGALCIAYEPVWAIGTGRTATPEDAGAMHRFIRGRWAERHGAAAAEALAVLYGGSVKPDNADALLRDPDIDGALVGGASLRADDFAAIAAIAR